MKRILSLLTLFAVAIGLHAAAPDDQYVDAYNLIQQAENLKNDSRAAAARLLEAQKLLKQIQSGYPNWNQEVIKFRLDYVAERLDPLMKYVAAPAPEPQPAPAPKLTAAQLEEELAGAQAQIRSLEGEKAILEKKVKEALSIQPAAADPRELAKAEEKILALQKEKDLLAVAVEQEKAARISVENKQKSAADTGKEEAASAKAESDKRIAAADAGLAAARSELAKLKQDSEDLQNKLKEANGRLAAQSQSGDKGKEADNLKEQAVAAKAESDKRIATADAELAAVRIEASELKQKNQDLQNKLKEADSKLASQSVASDKAKDADQLQKKLDSVTKQLADLEAKGDEQLLANLAETRKLHARLAVLEAAPVPYTAEELAILKKMKIDPSGAPLDPPPAAAAATNAAPKHIASMKDLPPGAGPIMAEAQRAFRMRDYDLAEKKYREVLQQDEKNVYVLGHLATTYFAANKPQECEKTAVQALAIEPDDPASLYLLGNLRLQQNKLDEALDALSRSAQVNPTNAATQNALGSVLGQKGMLKQAETALRKALQMDPEYRDAHHNLAYVYASQKPPSLELARWHYQKALEFGRAKDAELEKLLEAKK